MSRFLLEADHHRGWFVHADQLSGSLYLAQGARGALQCFFREVEMRARPGNSRCFVLEDLAARRVQVIGFPGDTGPLQVSMDTMAKGTRFCVQASAADDAGGAGQAGRALEGSASAPAAAPQGAAWERGAAVFALEMFAREGAFLSLRWPRPGASDGREEQSAAAVAGAAATGCAGAGAGVAATGCAAASGELAASPVSGEPAASAEGVAAAAAAGTGTTGDAKDCTPRPVIVASGADGGDAPLLLRATPLRGAALPPLFVPEWRDSARHSDRRRASAPGAATTPSDDARGANGAAGPASPASPPAAAGKGDDRRDSWEVLDAKRLPGPEDLRSASSRGLLGRRSVLPRPAAGRPKRHRSTSSSSVLETLLAVGTGVSKAALDLGQALVSAPRAVPSRADKGETSHWPPKPRKSAD